MSDHKHHAVTLALYAGLGLVLMGLVAGCATLRTCAKPVEAQALQDAAGVLLCANTGKTLAQCEENQLAVEGGQLSQDLLMCGEAAIVNAANGAHAK